MGILLCMQRWRGAGLVHVIHACKQDDGSTLVYKLNITIYYSNNLYFRYRRRDAAAQTRPGSGR